MKELSPYEADLDWDAVTEPDEICPLLRSLGQATAKVHCVSDAGSDQALVDFQTEDAIVEAVGDEDEAFAQDLAGVRRGLRRARPRRSPPLRGLLPQRRDPGLGRADVAPRAVAPRAVAPRAARPRAAGPRAVALRAR